MIDAPSSASSNSEGYVETNEFFLDDIVPAAVIKCETSGHVWRELLISVKESESSNAAFIKIGNSGKIYRSNANADEVSWADSAPAGIESFFVSVHVNQNSLSIGMLGDNGYVTQTVARETSGRAKITFKFLGAYQSNIELSTDISGQAITDILTGHELSWAPSIPENFANNAFVMMGNELAPAIDDGDILIGNAVGNGVQRILKQPIQNSDGILEGTINKYNKPRTPLALTDDITINNPSNQGDLFVVPNTQVTPIEIELLDPSTSDYFYFTVLNKSNQAVTFSDGSNPIVDAYGFGSVTQGGLVTVLWDGNEWMISGGLD